MTAIACRVSAKDIVVAADGLARDLSGEAEDIQCAYKSVRLSERLCLACTGVSDHAKEVLEALDPRVADLDPDDPFRDWENRYFPLEVGFGEALSIVKRVQQKTLLDALREMKNEANPIAIVTAFFLFCKSDASSSYAVVTSRKEDGGWKQHFQGDTYSSGDSREAILVGGLEPNCTAYELTLNAARDRRYTKTADGLVEGIRKAAELSGAALGINRNVLVRRASKQFKPSWAWCSKC